jgi:hypothetical protein
VRRHHVLILVVSGILLVLAVLVVVGFLNGGDAGGDLEQPPSETITRLLR